MCQGTGSRVMYELTNANLKTRAVSIIKYDRLAQANDKNANIAPENASIKEVDNVVSIVPLLKRDVSNIAEYLA